MKEYELIPSKFFLKQLDLISVEALQIIESKLNLIKQNPFRFKRIKGYDLFLFRIRFQDRRKEKRIIYLVNKPKVKIICILDRSNDYKDLKKFLNKEEII